MDGGVSVVIPAYNAQTHIERCVRSLLAQTVHEFEAVIASDDGVDYVELLKQKGIEDARLRCVLTGGTKTGSAHVRNVALKAANGRYIVSLDADDAIEPHYLSHMLPLAQEHGAAMCQVVFRNDPDGALLSNCSKHYDAGLIGMEDVVIANAHTYTCLVFDRQKTQLRWNEEVPLLVDVMLVAECCNVLGKIMYTPNPVYHYYHRSDSLCNSPQAPERFRAAGQAIRRLLDEDRLCAGNEPLKRIVRAYIDKNDRIEDAFEAAHARGEVQNYQQFIRNNLELLHTPLV
jgi:glycosyltransferase involved in cell wall biosynthesis